MTPVGAHQMLSHQTCLITIAVLRYHVHELLNGLACCLFVCHNGAASSTTGQPILSSMRHWADCQRVPDRTKVRVPV